nr:MAG TPA: hypothetical protein [Caudoviricetes sp.]
MRLTSARVGRTFLRGEGALVETSAVALVCSTSVTAGCVVF